MRKISEGIQTQCLPVQRHSQITQTDSSTESVHDVTQSQRNLIKVLRDLDSKVLDSLCESIGIDISTPCTSIMTWVRGLSEEKYTAFLRILMVLCQEDFDKHSRVFGLGFHFHKESLLSSILHRPVFVVSGLPLTEKITLRVRKSPRKRVVIQSISGSTLSWPSSFSVSINGVPMCTSYSNSSAFFDITDALIDKTDNSVSLSCEAENEWFCIVIRFVTKYTHEELISEVCKTKFTDPETPACCPITGKVMQIPVRASTCSHSHCCEFSALLERGLLCPVCGDQTQFANLGVNIHLMEKLEGLRTARRHSELKFITI